MTVRDWHMRKRDCHISIIARLACILYKTEIGTGERNTDLVVISRNGRRTNTCYGEQGTLGVGL